LEAFQEILTIPTVGTEQDQPEGMTFICRHDSDGTFFADNKTVSFVMKSLTVWQLRLFATKFDVPQSLVMTRKPAFVNLMKAFKQNPNSVKTSITMRAAAIQAKLDGTSIGTNRLISTLFGSTFKELYAQLNNDKNHQGYEITFGANNKIFWNNVVDSVNCGDGEDEEVKHKLLPCKDSYIMAKEYQGYMAAATNEDPGLVLPVPLTVKGAQKTVSYLLKARKTIETNMHKKTGMGEADVMKFTAVAQGKALCVRQVSLFSIYYFYTQCTFNTDVLASLTTEIPPELSGASMPGKKPKAARGSKHDGVGNLTKLLADNAEKLAFTSQQQHAKRMLIQQERYHARVIADKEKAAEKTHDKRIKLL
jgi:hypothetical protein